MRRHFFALQEISCRTNVRKLFPVKQKNRSAEDAQLAVRNLLLRNPRRSGNLRLPENFAKRNSILVFGLRCFGYKGLQLLEGCAIFIRQAAVMCGTVVIFLDDTYFKVYHLFFFRGIM